MPVMGGYLPSVATPRFKIHAVAVGKLLQQLPPTCLHDTKAPPLRPHTHRSNDNAKAFEYLGNSLAHDPRNPRTILAAGSIIQVGWRCFVGSTGWATPERGGDAKGGGQQCLQVSASREYRAWAATILRILITIVL